MNTKTISMHMAFAFDQNFVKPAYVLLTSIFSTTQRRPITFHVIATGVSDREKANIKKYVMKNDCEIIFYDVDRSRFENFIIPVGTHFSLATYYRLFIPELVPAEITNLLYIDTDLIAIGSLADLYDINLINYPVGAVSDSKIGLRPDLGITEAENYFNAGVLLINVSNWKAQQVSKKAIQFMAQYPECIQWVDQDALNAVLQNNWYKLEKKYNVTFYDIPEYLPRRKFSAFINGKVIIHFTTQNKPWLLTCRNRLKFLYHQNLAKTPYVSQEKYGDAHLRRKYRYELFRLRVKEALIDTGLLQTLRRIKAAMG